MTTSTLTKSQREALAACYRYILSLGERKKKIADRGSLDSEPQPAAEGASDKAERGSSVQ